MELLYRRLVLSVRLQQTLSFPLCMSWQRFIISFASNVFNIEVYSFFSLSNNKRPLSTQNLNGVHASTLHDCWREIHSIDDLILHDFAKKCLYVYVFVAFLFDLLDYSVRKDSPVSLKITSFWVIFVIFYFNFHFRRFCGIFMQLSVTAKVSITKGNTVVSLWNDIVV